jgi:uncharacterized lipoprotein YbaY
MQNMLIPVVALTASLWLSAAAAPMPPAPAEAKPQEVKVLRRWQGGMAGAGVIFLPKDQRDAPAGFIADPVAWETFWPALGKADNTPPVDFKTSLVLFVRDVTELNANPIDKVTLTGGVLEARVNPPEKKMIVEDALNVSLVEVPREGVKAVRCGPAKTLDLPPPGDFRTLAGTVEFARPEALGTELVAEVALINLDISTPRFQPLGRQVIKAPKAFPFAFAVPYDAAAIKPDVRYAIHVVISSMSGRASYATKEPVPVINKGPVKDIKINVVPTN